MHMLEHRLQILLDDDRHRRISRLARERGVSVAAIVREAIDNGLSSPQGRRAAAASRLLGAPAMSVPAPEGLRAELEELRGRRG
jgi:hypothetical protein